MYILLTADLRKKEFLKTKEKFEFLYCNSKLFSDNIYLFIFHSFRLIISLFRGFSSMLRSCKIAFSAANTKQRYEIFFVNKFIETFPSAANSVLMSAAAYLVHKFPSLPHPRLMKEKLPHNRTDTSEQSPYLSLHPLFDEWVDTFVEAVLSGNACRFG